MLGGVFPCSCRLFLAIEAGDQPSGRASDFWGNDGRLSKVPLLSYPFAERIQNWLAVIAFDFDGRCERRGEGDQGDDNQHQQGNDQDETARNRTYAERDRFRFCCEFF
jgi:hypothetical protein